MPRTARAAVGGVCYHVLNRGNGRMGVFRKADDYAAFVGLLGEAKRRVGGVELFEFCLMPNHWHLAVRPAADGQLAAFMSWLTNTHVKRYRAHYRRTSGHLYQGRYKSFPVETDGYLLTLLRYAVANPVRAGLVRRAVDWPWSGLGCVAAGGLLDPWPVDRPADWAAVVDVPLEGEVASRVAASLARGRPLGSDAWTRATAAQLGLAYTLNPRGRPKMTGTASVPQSPKRSGRA
jgi:putative transposase